MEKDKFHKFGIPDLEMFKNWAWLLHKLDYIGHFLGYAVDSQAQLVQLELQSWAKTFPAPFFS